MTGARGLLADVGWDVALPVAVYYAARAAGAGEFGTLVAAATAAAARLGLVALTQRRLDGLAAFMVGLYATAMVLSFVTGDARVLLLKDSVPEAIGGIALLVSAAVRRPLLLALARRLGLALPTGPDGVTAAGVHRTARALTVFWGAALLGFAALRVPVILSVDPDLAVLLVNGAFAVLAALLLGVSAVVATPWVRSARSAGRTTGRSTAR